MPPVCFPRCTVSPYTERAVARFDHPRYESREYEEAMREISAGMAKRMRPVIRAMVDAGTKLRCVIQDQATCVNEESFEAAAKLVHAKQKLFDKAIGDAAMVHDKEPVIIRGHRVYRGSDWERKIFRLHLSVTEGLYEPCCTSTRLISLVDLRKPAVDRRW